MSGDGILIEHLQCGCHPPKCKGHKKGVGMKKFQEAKSEAKIVWENFYEFTQALSLTTVSVFTLIFAYGNRDYSPWMYALFGAAALQVLIAFGLLVKHFSKK